MKNRTTTIANTGASILSMMCNNKEVDDIIIYDESSNLFDIRNSFISLTSLDDTKMEKSVDKFVIDKVRNANKLDLSKHDNFLLGVSDPIMDKVYNLYIFNGNGIKISNVKDSLMFENSERKLYKKTADIEFLYEPAVVCGDKVQKGTTFINTVSKHEAKPYGKFIDNLYCNMFAKGITISPEDLKNLLKYYDIIEKPQEA